MFVICAFVLKAWSTLYIYDSAGCGSEGSRLGAALCKLKLILCLVNGMSS